MTPTSNDKPSQAPLPQTTTPTKQPGWYWWKRDDGSREIMVEVRNTNGELTVRWPTFPALSKNFPVSR